MRITGGEFRGRILQVPRGRSTRPTADRTREALFSILTAQQSFEGLHVLDLFAGTGALGLEALSRGAQAALFVEQDHAVCHLLQNNIASCATGEKASLMRRDATRLGAARRAFDLVFADPPYGQGLAEKTLAGLQAQGWLSAQARLIVEEDRRSDFAAPDGFHETDRRQYGDTELIFLRLLSSPAD
ncbi:MAG: 16S rRNA (guanine(966)-N(2))-methyltransferase RsmD [Parvibaculales bacterium]